MNKRLIHMANLVKLSGILGVSPATISRVLNNHPSQRISESKRKLIIDAAKRYNYRPNMASRALAMRKRMNVAMVLYGLTHHHPTNAVMMALEKTLQEHHYALNVVFVSHADPAGSFKKLIRTHRTFDALVFHSYVGTRELVEIAREHRIPNAIMVDIRAVNWPTNYFHFDEDGDTRNAIRHVMSLGHRKIAVVGWDVAGWCADDTCTRCARDFLIAEGIDVRDDWIISIGDKKNDPFYSQRDHGRNAARKLFSGNDAPTAVVAWGDMIAMGVVDILHERGLAPGKDVAVTGYGNEESPARVPPEQAMLTTFEFPLAELGKAAAETLLRQIDNPNLPLERLLVPSKLIVRRSTQPNL